MPISAIARAPTAAGLHLEGIGPRDTQMQSGPHAIEWPIPDSLHVSTHLINHPAGDQEIISPRFVTPSLRAAHCLSAHRTDVDENIIISPATTTSLPRRTMELQDASIEHLVIPENQTYVRAAEHRLGRHDHNPDEMLGLAQIAYGIDPHDDGPAHALHSRYPSNSIPCRETSSFGPTVATHDTQLRSISFTQRRRDLA
jgi:hypothetical protein